MRVCLVRRPWKPHLSLWQNDSLQRRAETMPLLSDQAFVYIWVSIARGCHESDVLIKQKNIGQRNT